MRIRTIKPEFFTHEGLHELEAETKLPIRIAFAGLWCVADREGRFKWEPRRIGVAILPYDYCDFSRVLDALMTRGFVRKYRVENRDYGVIPSFSRHQVINNREKTSELPEPSPADDSDATGTREGRVGHAGKEEGKGREGERKGREVAPPEVSEDASIPTESEVIAFGAGPAGIPPRYCATYYAKTTEKRVWLNSHHQLIDWKRQIVRWWAGDKSGWSEAGGRQEPPKKKVICTL